MKKKTGFNNRQNHMPRWLKREREKTNPKKKCVRMRLIYAVFEIAYFTQQIGLWKTATSKKNNSKLLFFRRDRSLAKRARCGKNEKENLTFARDY